MDLEDMNEGERKLYNNLKSFIALARYNREMATRSQQGYDALPSRLILRSPNEASK